MADELIVGYGEIGKAVGQAIGEHDFIDLEAKDTQDKYDVLHICFPYQEGFLGQVLEYKEKYTPRFTIIWSTVPIGTTKKIKEAVHSPVEGKHPDLAKSIGLMPRWFGSNDMLTGRRAMVYFKAKSFKTYWATDSDWTEALKLLSTTEYGLNIEFARYKKHIADSLDMPFDITKAWNSDYNALYQDLGLPDFQKFILDAPEGPKGGHCVTPNAKLLHEQYPSELTKIVGEL